MPEELEQQLKDAIEARKQQQIALFERNLFSILIGLTITIVNLYFTLSEFWDYMKPWVGNLLRVNAVLGVILAIPITAAM